MNFLLFLTAMLILPGNMLLAQSLPSVAPNIGDNAPDFTLPYATKDSVAAEDLTLSALIGKRSILLAFYPADWSGGCTKEVCTLRDNFTTLAALDAEILGISGDYVYSHREWAKFHNLPFKLVADHNHSAARAYDSYNDESGYNKRTVFVIDRNGKIAYRDLQYSVKDSVSFEKLKAALNDISK